MESLLWGLDLIAVAYLCLWALKQEKCKEKAEREKEKTDA